MQEAALFGDLTIRENLEYACRLKQPVTTTAHQVIHLLPQYLACILSAQYLLDAF